MAHFKLLLPFSALAVTFILIGFILNDVNQVHFGVVWLIIAVLAFIIRKFKHHKT